MLTSYDIGQQKMVNRAINACLRPLAGLDGTMVTTTQGIGSVKDGIDEVQYKLVVRPKSPASLSGNTKSATLRHIKPTMQP
jgi:xanthine dehydrogenase iron-sulfur cluster and FAD-binding subunit A